MLQTIPPDTHSVLQEKPQAGFSLFCQNSHHLLPAVRYASKKGASTAGELQSTGVVGIISISSKMYTFSNGEAVKIQCGEEKE